MADHFFDRHFLDIDVADVAGFEQLPAGFGHFRAWNLQLYRNRRLFGHFAKLGQVAGRFLLEGETENLVPRKSINDLRERTVEEDFAVVDHQDAMTKFLDILHIMAGQQRDDTMFLVVDTQKLADTFLTHDIQPNGRLVEKQHARLMNEGGDQLHLHSFAQR